MTQQVLPINVLGFYGMDLKAARNVAAGRVEDDMLEAPAPGHVATLA